MKKLKTIWQYAVPQHLISRTMSLLAKTEIVWLKNWLIDLFIKHYHVNMQEAVETNPHAYKSFNQFFTRSLRADARQFAMQANAFISPVDGAISEYGRIEQGRLLQAKNHYYTVEELVGGDPNDAKLFANGHFITCYLAPKDYHRVHMPYAGTLRRMVHVPGRLFSVNPATVAERPRLFSRNERVVVFFDTDIGPMAVIFVGAMLVAGVSTQWSGIVTPPWYHKIRRWDYSAQPQCFARGEEVGHFELGSTVIVLLPDTQLQWQSDCQADKTLRLGELLGLIN